MFDWFATIAWGWLWLGLAVVLGLVFGGAICVERWARREQEQAAQRWRRAESLRKLDPEVPPRAPGVGRKRVGR